MKAAECTKSRMWLLLVASFPLWLNQICCFEVAMTLGQADIINIPANETTTLRVGNFSSTTRFVVIQLHSQKHELSLSSSPTFSYTTTKTGLSIGLLTILSPNKHDALWYVAVGGTQNVTALVYVHQYTAEDPLPGGCNQVFSLEIDPSIQVEYTDFSTKVWFQWANLATIPPYDCENSVLKNTLQYDVYAYYLHQRELGQGEFFDGVQNMLSSEVIMKNGQKIFTLSDVPTAKSLVKVVSQRGQGAVYSVVVTRNDIGTTAAYITSVTYACNMTNGECSNTSNTDATDIVLGLALGVVGVTLLFFGHRFFKTSQVIFGFTFFCLLALILLSLSHHIEDKVKVGVSVTSGVVGAGLWLGVWCLIGLPILSVFLVGLCAGYLVSSVLFFTPFGNLEWWDAEMNYGMAFTCVLLVFAVCLMAFTRMLNIVSCSIVGAYCMLMVIAIPLRSSLCLVFLNSLHKQTVPGLIDAKTVVPLNTQDVSLLTVWPLLVLVGIVFQFVRERHREPFPVPPRMFSKQQQPVSTQYIAEEEEDHPSRQEEEQDDERRRLITNSSHPSRYDSVNNTCPRELDKERNIIT